MAQLRVLVSDADVKEANGKYDTFGANLQQFDDLVSAGCQVYIHICNNSKWEYGLYLTKPTKEQATQRWIIARIDGEYRKKPFVCYYNDKAIKSDFNVNDKPNDKVIKAPNKKMQAKSKGLVPPTQGWKCIAANGKPPTISIEIISVPKKEKVSQQDELKKAYKLDSTKESKQKSNHNNVSPSKQFAVSNKLRVNDSHRINQPLPSKDMRRICGE